MDSILEMREMIRATNAAVARLEVCDYCAHVTDDTDVYVVGLTIRMRLCAPCVRGYERRHVEVVVLPPAPPRHSVEDE